ncbi:Carbohydrate-binding protein [Phytophthora palmivora]|uniref:Carbohydrate-binding protein n=1 Tax=Phytophthora palmivora TaxID=4796 RepID=A0A2P4YPC4_9STRA|nr:Carbohydrate-binding protein [Phytophthora palmivora]
MFRNGASAQATLAEFSVTGGYTWYDISIIPTGSSGPGNCASLEECKEVTGGTGFNNPMQIASLGCDTVTCLADGCADAYQYPSDDSKTHSCVDTASVTLTFCPDGSSSSTTTTTTPATAAPTSAAPTEPPTTAPVTLAPVTDAPPFMALASPTEIPTEVPTAAPVTKMPTQVPTEAPTTTPVTEAPPTEAPIRNRSPRLAASS